MWPLVIFGFGEKTLKFKILTRTDFIMKTTHREACSLGVTGALRAKPLVFKEKKVLFSSPYMPKVTQPPLIWKV